MITRWQLANRWSLPPGRAGVTGGKGEAGQRSEGEGLEATLGSVASEEQRRAGNTCSSA